MICHDLPDSGTVIPVFPLALAMIGPNLPVLLVAAVGPPPLFAPPPSGSTHLRSRPVPDSRNGRCKTSPRNLVAKHLSPTSSGFPWPYPARFHSSL